MTKYTGKQMAFVFGAFTIPAGALVSVDWPRSRDELEATGATQDDKEYMPSDRSATCTINGWDDAEGTIRAAFEATTAEDAGEFYPQGNSASKPKRAAEMFVTNISDPVTHNAVTPITITLRINGAVTHSTVAP